MWADAFGDDFVVGEAKVVVLSLDGAIHRAVHIHFLAKIAMEPECQFEVVLIFRAGQPRRVDGLLYAYFGKGILQQSEVTKELILIFGSKVDAVLRNRVRMRDV